MNKAADSIYAGKSVVIVIHEHARGGPGDALRDFLLSRGVSKLLLIGHPLLYMEQGRKRQSRFELYKQGKLSKEFEAPKFRMSDPLLYIKDFFYTGWWVLTKGIRSDVFVGIDPLNALSGIFLRQLGYTKCVVYYSIDYFPTRFSNMYLNKLYHAIDKFCVTHADETWNVGSGMADARMLYNNIAGKLRRKQYVVPIGVWLSKIRVRSFDKINKRKLIYAGHLVDFMGVDLVLRSMKEVIRRFPDATLDIVGTGEDEKMLKDFVVTLGIQKSVKFYGWMENREAFNASLSRGSVGLAPFNTDILDDKVKNADPGKIKDYMAVGLPVIVTKAINNFKAINDAGAGIVINYSQESFVQAVADLFESKNKLYQYRMNALSYVSQFDWEIIFNKNLKRVFERII